MAMARAPLPKERSMKAIGRMICLMVMGRQYLQMEVCTLENSELERDGAMGHWLTLRAHTRVDSKTTRSTEGACGCVLWAILDTVGCLNMTSPNGRTFEGEFYHGMQHSQGVNTFVNGNVYIGAFYEGDRNGNGTLLLVLLHSCLPVRSRPARRSR
mmetsp:Transcript_11377/g.20087  ORF Transcript_11377/g.20087 Transcript_11377/m.20087 type:complete len:156 (+) Transcript_11377:356-823(+)